MGLTTARLVQEAGFPVTIYTAALPPDTTSNIAGGQWSPYATLPQRRHARMAHAIRRRARL
jgi:glycine/D-amino acid oxidase-like deaminating enzyme